MEKQKTISLPPLYFHNTLSDSLELFTPLSPRKVKMYNCGPTVYDQIHIGNLRAYLFANTLRRVLDGWQYNVEQVINITDVGHLTGDNLGDADQGEDRMEASARKQGISAHAIAEDITERFFSDLDLLGIDRSRILFPRATEHIEEQINLVQTLEEKGYTYTTSDGVYFDTTKFPTYGKLGAITLSGQKEGARVQENPEKKNPHDFALWKFSKEGENRQQEWPSPWGVGFPGWHIECTAMIFKTLGKQIDIHTGGIDHIAIHHNNEIAQAEAVTGKPFVKYWMHGAFITIEGKKVSKSLGNTVYLHGLIDHRIAPRALRYWFLTGHYRSPMNFTWDALEGAHTALMRLTRFFFEKLPTIEDSPDPDFLQDFYASLAKDLDTPQALARVWELVKSATISPAVKRASLLAADQFLGLGLSEPRIHTSVTVTSIPVTLQTLLTARGEARETKDFAQADALRAQIEALGFEVIDTPEGQKVEHR